MLRGDEEAVQCEVRIIQEIMEGLSDPQSSLEPYQAMHVILVARSLTRVWRRSINIAEQVYFINQGESVKHKSEERGEEGRAAAKYAAAKSAVAKNSGVPTAPAPASEAGKADTPAAGQQVRS